MTYATKRLREEKVFKDPVHAYIHVQDQLIWDLIGTKEFQRLRRIRQLGTTYLVFHGAEHSRFQHSLGVYEIVRRLIDEMFEEKWSHEERLVALAAALLHDVGHGPFSHAFENVFQLDHESFTQQIITGPTEIHHVLRQVHADFPQQVASVIQKTYDNPLVTSLISSQIDADRMDYLQRDAYYTGVSYGHFDMERILRVMRPTENGVVIKSSGMHAVEDYIMSRYQMYWQVYFHPVSRSAEVILTKILHRARELYRAHYTFQYEPTPFITFFEGNPSLAQYIALDESVLLTYFGWWQEEEDPILSDLCERFLNRRLFQFASFDPATDNERFQTLKRLFSDVGLHPDYYLVTDASSDLPYDFYRPGEPSERVPIYLQMQDGSLRELSRASEIVDAISGKRRVDYKMYYPEDWLLRESKHCPKCRTILQHLQP